MYKYAGSKIESKEPRAPLKQAAVYTNGAGVGRGTGHQYLEQGGGKDVQMKLEEGKPHVGSEQC